LNNFLQNERLLSYNLVAKTKSFALSLFLIKQSEVTPNSGSPMSHRQYQNPPIEEAVCEFRFAPSLQWNLTVPGLLYEKIKTNYPGEPKQQNLIQAEFQIGQLPINPGFALKQGTTKLLFQSTDGKKLVGVGPDMLSIHSLRPYEGWDSFAERIKESFHSYIEVAKPQGIKHLALRYINKIVIPEQNIDLGKYFTVYPLIPEGIPDNVSSFLVRTQTIYTDIPIVLKIALSDIANPDEQPGFILDLELSQNYEQESLNTQESLATLYELKLRERKVFESLITEHTRELFDVIN